MTFKIVFYIHHHGLGHFMRAMSIINVLQDYEIIIMGSSLHFQTELPANVRVVHLPQDVADDTDIYYDQGPAVRSFHYAPLNVGGIRSRSAIMTDIFKAEHPILLIVDVSVEVALLARLCSIPTIIMRQHGKRDDLPHQLAYQSASLLIAPFPESMYRGEKDEAYAKTLFTGGFSKFGQVTDPATGLSNHIAIILGGGGNSITPSFISSMANECPDYHFHILGKINADSAAPNNVKRHGHLEHPRSVIESCMIVIGNTGHNTVMEMANLNKRFIGIPEPRPFDEQTDKAEAIRPRQGVCIVLPEHLSKTDWQQTFKALSMVTPDWNGVISTDALVKMKTAIVETGNRLFNVGS